MEEANLKSLVGLLGSISDADKKYIDIQVAVAAMVLKKRLAMDMSKKSFATLMDVSSRMITEWESGDHNFKLSEIVQICDKLNLNFTVSWTDKSNS
jgi:DNA-binding XRE family transcriptional regulator